MPEAAVIEPFEQQIIDSIENLLLDDDNIPDVEFYGDGNNVAMQQQRIVSPVALVPDVQPPKRGGKKPKFQLNLNQKYFKTNLNACGNNGFALSPPKSPIIAAGTYGGTQDYVRWSTIESDELTMPDQVPYQATNGTSPQPLPRTPTTPISPMSEYTLDSLSPISQLSPIDSGNNGAQFLFNQYLLNNQQQIADEMRIRNLANLLNITNSTPNASGVPLTYINSALNTIAYNQMMQQRLFNSEQEYQRIMNYCNNGKPRRPYAVTPKTICTFCKNNGEPQ